MCPGLKQWQVWVAVFLTTFAPLANRVAGQILQCLGTDGCRCTLDDGSVIDVSSLGNSDGTPRFDKVLGLDSFYYSINPCYPFTENKCVDAAVCQLTSDQSAYFQAGDAKSAQWSYDGISTAVYYESNTDAFRQSFVTYTCDPSATTPELTATGELGFSTYYFEIRSQCACPNGCSPGDSGAEEGGLSPGSIVLIVFFSLVFVYLAGGIAFNRTRRQATGADMIPNASIWIAVPGLIKDGFGFVIGKIRGVRGGYSEV